MKIDKVFYQKSFAIGPYLQEKIGIEIQLDENDNEDEAIKLAKATIEGWKSDTTSFMMMNIDTGLREVVEVSKMNEDQRIAAIISDIYSCKELKVLESYRLMVKSNPQLQEAYDQQFKKLQNNQQ